MKTAKPTLVERLWIVLDPVADNPPVVLYSDPSERKARAWCHRNRPDGVVTTMPSRLAESGFSSIGAFHREYEPDTERQVQALKILAKAAEEDD